MSKDPAFLFYSSDFLTGTMFLSDEQVGKYVRLLCAQHQKGHLSEEDMLKICKTYDKHIYENFKKDSKGRFYNERLDKEAKRRKEYSKSRRLNRLGRKKICKTYDKHMETVTVTDTIIRNIKHLSITNTQHRKLLVEYSEQQIQSVYDGIENHAANKKYSSLYLTALDWLKRRHPNGKRLSPLN